jgi:hypothetical protein
MDISILAARNANAQARLIAAAERIGGALGLADQVEALKAARSREPEVDPMVKREAIADLLEAIARQVAPAIEITADQPPVLDQAGAVDGVSAVEADAGADQPAPVDLGEELPPPVVKAKRKGAK